MQSAKLWINFLILLLFFFIFQAPVFAEEVVINEFLVDPDKDQWVELYNKGTISTDISGWVIDDGKSDTQKFTIPSETTINPNEFKVFESSYFNLNRKTADTINLLNESTVEDSYSYATGPGENASYGRDSDGVGNWVVFNTPTKGSTNNTSTPAPTATPTFTPSPTPTKTPTPTPTKTPTPTPTTKPSPTPKTPTPTKIPTPTKTLTPSPTPKPISTLTPTPKLSVASESLSNEKVEVVPTSILGESTASVEDDISPTNEISTKKSTRTKDSNVVESTQNNLSKILIGVGVIFLIACGILVFRNYIRNRKSDEI